MTTVVSSSIISRLIHRRRTFDARRDHDAAVVRHDDRGDGREVEEEGGGQGQGERGDRRNRDRQGDDADGGVRGRHARVRRGEGGGQGRGGGLNWRDRTRRGERRGN